MTIHYNKNNHLEFSSVRMSNTGEIEVVDYKSDALSVYFVEYELDWYVVFEFEPEIFESFLIEEQLDIYRLNATL